MGGGISLTKIRLHDAQRGQQILALELLLCDLLTQIIDLGRSRGRGGEFRAYL